MSEIRVRQGEIPRRQGPRPETNPRPPHTQVTQTAPPELQEELFARAAALPGVEVGRSLVSVPDARAFHLRPDVAGGPRAAFQAGTEFAHLHPSHDGSLHLTLPPSLATRAAEEGWTEPHPIGPGVVMVYGPRDGDELEVVWQLVVASYRWACDQPEEAGT